MLFERKLYLKEKKIQKSIQRANIFLNVEKKSNKFKHKTKKKYTKNI